jgi:hypothetical protein
MATELLHLRHTRRHIVRVSKERRRGQHTSATIKLSGPFTPRAGASDSSSTLLVQAVPHASRLRQMVCGQGLATVGAFTPRCVHCCLLHHARLVL